MVAESVCAEGKDGECGTSLSIVEEQEQSSNVGEGKKEVGRGRKEGRTRLVLRLEPARTSAWFGLVMKEGETQLSWSEDNVVIAGRPILRSSHHNQILLTNTNFTSQMHNCLPGWISSTGCL